MLTMRDLGRRILMHFQQKQSGPVDYPEDTILVGGEVSVMQLADVPMERLAGLVSAKGVSALPCRHIGSSISQ